MGDGLTMPNGVWDFGRSAVVFDSHVKKSVPIYEMGHDLFLRYSDFFIKSDSLVLDIGCSTGTLAGSLLRRHSEKSLRVIGLEPEIGFHEHLRELSTVDPRFEVSEHAIEEFESENTDLIICFLTMQFINPGSRFHVFAKIHELLNPGGGFLMMEKVRAPTPRFESYAAQTYEEYKLGRGFSASEVLSKAQSLKGVMEPLTTQENLSMLRGAGFREIMTVVKWVNFEGFLAVKSATGQIMNK